MTTINPYAPPGHTSGPKPQEPLPVGGSVIPRVFGILSIVFSSLTIVMLMLGFVVGLVASERRGKAKQAAAIAPEAEDTSEVGQEASKSKTRANSVQAGAGICVGVAWLLGPFFLLAIGIGQLRYKRWARLATLGWSGVVLLAMAAFFVLAAFGGMGIAELIPFAFLTVFSCAYPVLLLVFFSRPRVALVMVR
ncbi:MAG: hypothetical protein JRH20_12145 [Deltaproteobacteria bacterium]|nr:hypothetical protein [Deltaproteobacteria bacterium]